MPNPKDFRVVPGGKASQASAVEPTAESVSQLRERVGRYRIMFAEPISEDTRSLLSDFADAVETLGRLELAAHPTEDARIQEYRQLIAELDAEIASVWSSGAEEC